MEIRQGIGTGSPPQAEEAKVKQLRRAPIAMLCRSVRHFASLGGYGRVHKPRPCYRPFPATMATGCATALWLIGSRCSMPKATQHLLSQCERH